MSDLADEVLAKRFTTTRFRAGYDMDEIDGFLDQVVLAVRRGDDLTPLVDGALFRTVSFAEGYDINEVDDFLDDLKVWRPAAGTGPTTAGTPAGTPTGTPAGTPPTRATPSASGRPDSSTVPEPTLPTRTGGLSGWLFGRR